MTQRNDEFVEARDGPPERDRQAVSRVLPAPGLARGASSEQRVGLLTDAPEPAVPEPVGRRRGRRIPRTTQRFEHRFIQLDYRNVFPVPVGIVVLFGWKVLGGGPQIYPAETEHERENRRI